VTFGCESFPVGVGPGTLELPILQGRAPDDLLPRSRPCAHTLLRLLTAANGTLSPCAARDGWSAIRGALAFAEAVGSRGTRASGRGW
jgi:hypothetical protein